MKPSIYIKLREGEVAKSKNHIKGNDGEILAIADYDREGRIVGVEFLDYTTFTLDGKEQ